MDHLKSKFTDLVQKICKRKDSIKVQGQKKRILCKSDDINVDPAIYRLSDIASTVNYVI